MVTLEQIRQLDARVHRAVELIDRLREENTTLKNRLSEYQRRIEELEVLISNFKEDQSEIENGITNALSQLAAIDDSAKPTNPEKGSQKAEQPLPKSATSPEPPQPPTRDEPQPSATTEEGESENQDAELDIF